MSSVIASARCYLTYRPTWTSASRPRSITLAPPGWLPMPKITHPGWLSALRSPAAVKLWRHAIAACRLSRTWYFGPCGSTSNWRIVDGVGQVSRGYTKGKMETFTLNAGAWIRRLATHRPLVRTNDRVEAVLTLLILVIVVLALPVAGAMGTTAYDSRSH